MCEDYLRWCDEIGFSDAVLRPLAADNSDLVGVAVGVEVRRSRIDGDGIFAMSNHNPGDTICFSRIFGRTKAGRYVNHSQNPNAKFSGDINIQTLVATMAIRKGGEITINYRGDGVINTDSIKPNKKG